ncbi:IS701 family transposase [Catellatospora methionotrophica]|uniref:IS701 family transposase n=1 Tax=Catellatospora methionotrophica TaxID=121620 RepID=UPI003F4CC425
MVWWQVFEGVLTRVGGRFARAEPRCTVRELLLGLLAPIERKNGWWLAEQAGHDSPDRMQRLLRTAVWDTDAVAADLRAFVVEHLGHRDGILVADETGYLKKGTHSVGVQRQYSGTAGRVENFQIGVFLAYVSPQGRALIDRRLYLPRCWSDDERRYTTAGVPDEVLFATKPELAMAMIDAAVTAKGHRFYAWAWVTVLDEGEGCHSLLVRRGTDGQLAYYLCWSPTPVPLLRLVTVAGSRWSVEEAFQTAKGQVGLDQYQCRGWTAWHRFTLLAMIALAVLTIVAIAQRAATSTDDLIDLTLAETRRLINTAIHRTLPTELAMAWSRWRRRHQAIAKRSHYKRRHESTTSA